MNKYPRQLNTLFPKIFGKGMVLATHRGYGKMGPVAENTIEAFRKSTKAGFRMHELDVRLSKDGAIVLFHGPKLERTTTGFGKLEKKTFAELATLDWGYYLENSVVNENRNDGIEKKTTKRRKINITTLDEYLKEFGATCITNIEIKKEWYMLNRRLENSVMECIKKHKLEKRIIFSSFNVLSMRYIRQKFPEMPVGILKDKSSPLLPFWAPLLLKMFIKIVKPDSLHLHPKLVRAKRIRKYKEKGYGILVWKINDKKTYRFMKNVGVDIAVTDNINLIKELK